MRATARAASPERTDSSTDEARESRCGTVALTEAVAPSHRRRAQGTAGAGGPRLLGSQRRPRPNVAAKVSPDRWAARGRCPGGRRRAPPLLACPAALLQIRWLFLSARAPGRRARPPPGPRAT